MTNPITEAASEIIQHAYDWSVGHEEIEAIIEKAAKSKTCDACRHWGVHEANGWHSSGCSDHQPPSQKFCGCPKVTDGTVVAPADDIASAVDCEDYHAFLLTGPKFGCVHWEALQQPPEPRSDPADEPQQPTHDSDEQPAR